MSRTEPFDIPGLGLVPMLYIEIWSVYEAFRRLGFKDEDTTMEVVTNIDTGYPRPNFVHLNLNAQGLKFVYSILPLDRPYEEARTMLDGLYQAIREKRVPDEQLTEMYRASHIGALDGRQFESLALALVAKGFHLPMLAN